MPTAIEPEPRSRCTNCGFETSTRDEWDAVEAPPLGEMTQCPECGSTNVVLVPSGRE